MTVDNPSSLSAVTGIPAIARLSARGSRFATFVSMFAFVFSAVSFYETVLKLPSLSVYVTDTLSYNRDPWGGYEVIAVPLTVANSGAHGGAVITFSLDVTNPGTGKSETFSASYFAGPDYFGSADDISQNRHRPKQPFAPIAVAGRSAFSGTILFYPPNGARVEDAIVAPKSDVTMALRTVVPEPRGWLQRWLSTAPDTITLSAGVGDYLPGALLAGESARLRMNRKIPKD